MSERCNRNPRCLKAAGHAGWCKTKPGQDDIRSQDDLFASGAGVKRTRRGPGLTASRMSAMQELGRKREAKQGKRRVGRLPSDDEDEEDEDEYVDCGEEDGDDDWGGRSRRDRRASARYNDDDGTGTGGVEFADYGLSRNERKTLRERGRLSGSGIHDEEDDEQGYSDQSWSGPPAALGDLESIRIRRQVDERLTGMSEHVMQLPLQRLKLRASAARTMRMCDGHSGRWGLFLHDLCANRLPLQVLEKWLLEPFFETLVPGCFIRIGLQIPGEHGTSTLYRVAEVLDVKEQPERPYPFAGRSTSKYLRLEFGDSQEW